MKKKYEEPEMEIVFFGTYDIICSSGNAFGDDEVFDAADPFETET